eukprot:TRINITY_DN2094_c1_g8_i1.p1 TRINITY_DN2094_c1_g8~~TRINITY_DN2094_c1_g8_i1.p1  ORF type:complete len:424 (+),score=46.30 TRINITY_DN2094_c1_g8_i1:102-1373(+)
MAAGPEVPGSAGYLNLPHIPMRRGWVQRQIMREWGPVSNVLKVPTKPKIASSERPPRRRVRSSNPLLPLLPGAVPVTLPAFAGTLPLPPRPSVTLVLSESESPSTESLGEPSPKAADDAREPCISLEPAPPSRVVSVRGAGSRSRGERPPPLVFSESTACKAEAKRLADLRARQEELRFELCQVNSSLSLLEHASATTLARGSPQQVPRSTSYYSMLNADGDATRTVPSPRVQRMMSATQIALPASSVPVNSPFQVAPFETRDDNGLFREAPPAIGDRSSEMNSLKISASWTRRVTVDPSLSALKALSRVFKKRSAAEKSHTMQLILTPPDMSLDASASHAFDSGLAALLARGCNPSRSESAGLKSYLLADGAGPGLSLLERAGRGFSSGLLQLSENTDDAIYADTTPRTEPLNRSMEAMPLL